MARKRRYLTETEEEKLDEVKRHLCRVLRRSMARRNHPTQSAFAALMQTSRSRVCQVQCADVRSLTINQLMAYLVKLEPGFELLIAI